MASTPRQWTPLPPDAALYAGRPVDGAGTVPTIVSDVAYLMGWRARPVATCLFEGVWDDIVDGWDIEPRRAPPYEYTDTGTGTGSAKPRASAILTPSPLASYLWWALEYWTTERELYDGTTGSRAAAIEAECTLRLQSVVAAGASPTVYDELDVSGSFDGRWHSFGRGDPSLMAAPAVAGRVAGGSGGLRWLTVPAAAQGTLCEVELDCANVLPLSLSVWEVWQADV